MARGMKYFNVILFAVIVLGLSGGAYSAEFVMRTAYEEVPNSVDDLILKHFANIIKKESGGRIDVKLYPGGMLFPAKETLEACMVGSIEFVSQPTSQVAKLTPLGSVISCPGLYKDIEARYRFQKSPEAIEVFKILEEKNLHVLGHDNSSLRFIFLSNGKPIKEPRDLAGLKIRSWPAEFPQMMIKSVGAIPVVVSLAEVTMALHQKAIDGIFTSLTAAYDGGFHKLTKYYVTGILLSCSPRLILVNKKFWESLPKDLQGIIKKAQIDTMDYGFKLLIETEQKILDDLRKRGDLYLLDNAANADLWAKTVNPVLDYFVKQISPNEWEMIQRGVGLVK